MMDVSNEDLIPISDVPRHLPPRATGRRVHKSAVYRWIRHGVRGGIRLEAAKVGGSTYTSKEALQRFAQRLSEADHLRSSTRTSTTASRQKQIDEAARQAGTIFGNNKSNRRPG